MAKKARGASRQPDLFPRSKRPTISIDPNHRLVLLTEETDWTELEEPVEQIRMSKLKSAAGRPPHLRALTGARALRQSCPCLGEPRPRESIGELGAGPRVMPVVDGELVAQGETLELESNPPAEGGAERCDERNEDGHHGGDAGYLTKELTGSLRRPALL